jgi:hypothetical protein
MKIKNIKEKSFTLEIKLDEKQKRCRTLKVKELKIINKC